MTKPYPETVLYFRPGIVAPRKVHTALLQTCRLVYYETNAIPMRSATHYHWTKHRPPHAPWPRYAEMTAKNIADLNHVHIFQNARTAKDSLRKLIELEQFKPKIITVTIRHTDWCNWMQLDKPLQFEPRSLWQMKLPDECKEFRLELETIESRREELEELAQDLRDRKFTKRSGQTMRIADGEYQISSWTGRIGMHEIRWQVHDHVDTLKYHVITITWVPKTSDTPSMEEFGETGPEL
jgi:hypothetical protein